MTKAIAKTKAKAQSKPKAVDYNAIASAAVDAAIMSCQDTHQAIDAALRAAMRLTVANGDTRQLNRLINHQAVDKSVHGNILIKWCVEHFEWLTYSASDKVLKVHRDWHTNLKQDSDFNKTSLFGLIDVSPSYIDMKNPKAPFKGFVFAVELQKLITKARKMEAKHQKGEMSDEDWSKVNLQGLIPAENLTI